MLTNSLKYTNRKKTFIVFVIFMLSFLGLYIRICYLCSYKAEYYSQKADQIHERERNVKAKRGKIIDRNGVVLADNQVVCTISVVHNQIEDEDKVIELLSSTLDIDKATISKKVKKYTSIEKIKSNVEEETGDYIEAQSVPGIKVDRDYKRYYPYGTLASKVLGFTGADNQGIIGLEVKYDEYLMGEKGTILTLTDARGVEVKNAEERLINPVAGNDLYISLDRNIQSYAEQLAKAAYIAKDAAEVMLLVMNPNNGEIYACVNYPEFDLNNPYSLIEPYSGLLSGANEAVSDNTISENQAVIGSVSMNDCLNQMWRNSCINDTYEPGSTFKIITAAAALEEGVVSTESTFSCPGYIVVDDRRIRCHKVTGHGSEDFIEATKNSCNPVFITIGLRLGVEKYYSYFKKFKLLEKTGIDLPGEANTIMHKPSDMGNVELATVSFGQSFQITPMRLLTTVSSIINGGTVVTPHFGVGYMETKSKEYKPFEYDTEEDIVSDETAETMKMILEKVVSEGSGKNGAVEGFLVGGKTATSQMLPRSSHKYISSFIGFAPANDPQVIAIAIVKEPQGIYYGSQVAAPIVRQLFENILPYLEKKEYNQKR